MSNNKGKNKTISFAEKKRAIYNKKNNVPKNTEETNRIVKYDLNKMREQINQRTRNKENTYSRPKWVKALYIIIIFLFSILLAMKVFTSLTNNTAKIPSKFVPEVSTISSSDRTQYENFVEKSLNTYIKSKGELNVKTTDIHKNNKYVYVHGYFTYPNEKDQIEFDATIIGKDDMSSLVVNGIDLVNKQ